MLYIQVSSKGVVGHAIPTWGLPVGHYLHSYKEVHQLEVTFCMLAALMADRLAKYFVPTFVWATKCIKNRNFDESCYLTSYADFLNNRSKFSLECHIGALM